jgi:hypothetical protein
MRSSSRGVQLPESIASSVLNLPLMCYSRESLYYRYVWKLIYGHTYYEHSILSLKSGVTHREEDNIPVLSWGYVVLPATYRGLCEVWRRLSKMEFWPGAPYFFRSHPKCGYMSGDPSWTTSYMKPTCTVSLQRTSQPWPTFGAHAR